MKVDDVEKKLTRLISKIGMEDQELIAKKEDSLQFKIDLILKQLSSNAKAGKGQRRQCNCDAPERRGVNTSDV